MPDVPHKCFVVGYASGLIRKYQTTPKRFFLRANALAYFI